MGYFFVSSYGSQDYDEGFRTQLPHEQHGYHVATANNITGQNGYSRVRRGGGGGVVRKHGGGSVTALEIYRDLSMGFLTVASAHQEALVLAAEHEL
jgi:hypothetical protein